MELQNNERRVYDFKPEKTASKNYPSFKNSLPTEPEKNGVDRSSINSENERLPILATSNDAREIVRFLKHHPGGLPVLEVLNSTPRRIFEASKIEAYEYWGIIRRDGDLLKLTATGNKLAEMITAESRVFEEIIAASPVYLATIEWIRDQTLKVITHHDAIGFWQRYQNKISTAPAGQTTEAEAVSFFSICHAAELGAATVGKRGQPARLRLEQKNIREFLLRVKDQEKSERTFVPGQSFCKNIEKENIQNNGAEIHRIYISGGQTGELTENLSAALELADFEKIVASESGKNDYLQSNKIQTMQSCQAGVIILNDEQCRINSRRQTEIKAETLTELAAAIALFNWRVIIIWNNLLAQPEHLQQYNLPVLNAEADDFKVSFQTVKILKSLKTLNQD